MTVERIVFIVAGFFVLLSLLLSLHNHYWLLFTAFVGANLFQSGFTGFCPLALILKKMGVPTQLQKANSSSKLQTSS
jgi:hypothetical protein